MDRNGIGVIAVFALAIILVSLTGVTVAASTSDCVINVSLLNQDPYPAVQGDYVKLVFQLQGIENPSCSEVTFQLMPQYPITFDPEVSSIVNVKGQTFVTDYNSYSLVPYKVRVSPNAVDGDNVIKTRYAVNGGRLEDVSVMNEFDLNVKDARTEFETYVSNFDFATNKLTIEILNSGKSNIDALTMEIPPQKGVVVKGSNRHILGSLDANEYTTSDFEVSPENAKIIVNIYYTDKVGVRRTATSTVSFDPTYFEGRKSQQKSNSTGIVVGVIVLLVIGFLIYRRYQKNKRKKLHSA